MAIYKLLGPALVAVGLVSLTFEAGRPVHSIYLLTNLRYSWMSREALAAGLFMVVAALDWLLPNPILQWIAAIAALAFIIAQGMMVLRAAGIVTWNVPSVPVFFLTCALASGCGLLLLVQSLSVSPFTTGLWLAALAIALANALVWFVYLASPGDTFQRGIAPLRSLNSLLLTIGVGHLLPIFLLLTALLLALPALIPLAGLLLVVGGVLQKFGFAFEGSAQRSLLHG